MRDMNEPQAVNDERARAGRIAAIRQVAWRGLLSHPDGRKFCYDLLEKGHIFVTSFREDALRSAFAEGERNFALQINSDMAASSPREYALMLEEASARKDTSDE